MAVIMIYIYMYLFIHILIYDDLIMYISSYYS